MRAYNIINGYFGIKEESLIFDKYFNLKGLLLIILFVIGYELYLQIIGFSLLHVGQLSAVEVKISRGDSVFASVFLQKILHQIILFLSYILIFRALVAQKSRLLLFFLFCILLFISIATGSRGVFITSFLLPMIFIYNAYIKKISIIKFFLVAYLIFVFLVSTHLLRHMDGFSFDDVVSSVYDATEVPKYVGLFLKRVDSFFPYFYKYWEAMSDDKLEFHYGMTYIESVLQFFPRQILSDKPDSFVRNINNELHLQSSD